MFGQSSAPAFGTAQTTGFGTTGQQQQSGGLFGAQPAQPKTGLFGAAPTTTAGNAFGGFGTTAPAFTMGSSLFGTAAPATSAPGTSLFGAPATTTIGASNVLGNAAGSGGMFAQPQPAAFGGGSGLFGQQSTTSGLFGQQQKQLVQTQQQQQQQQIVEAIMRMEAYWNPQSPLCNFKFYFYNMVHASEAHLYQPPPQEMGTYQQAQMNNPDPSCMVPVLAVGFGDLKKRMEVQEQQQAVHKEKLEMIATRVDALKTKHFVDTLVKLDEFRRRQRQMVHKTYMLLKTVQILRNRGYSIRVDEEALRSRFESMERDLQKPSIFRGRLNEIWAQLQQLKDSKRMSDDATFSIVDEDSLAPVLEALSEMQNGLSHFTKLIQNDQNSLEVMAQAYSETPYTR
ncbi:hypothetical protein BATDEDRAFT_89228 [Batrachochytrium dendrobatidis JAM81]|uniref:Nucleoporin Nup54 alpha-helical domain-containing protein n=2 Tax=Batrachochytrium dendrobatidis TaxID=109871 RepID=F4P4H9_BATDJ|nr:uncharacterized protein BATDEDRAFT_89228 [Batrachochytrium dendrobatidis JAM81]EGF80032.1 hypothetical protein BATDEDRAFT_89228 [Batrachochytrium dendrobatidis JAM81]KAJ8324989.1 hypothetical protein O5D80_006503 [Batrachochytrium dendrobatidis]|eukprot:XP_006679759.1 hypothetical protein BATDEDRAFT_89228 [Batrachochytrium dendrobatidis JAM81]